MSDTNETFKHGDPSPVILRKILSWFPGLKAALDAASAAVGDTTTAVQEVDAGVDLLSPASDGYAVAPDDANDLTYPARGFRVGTTAGDVKVTTADGQTRIVPGVQLGETVALRITRVWAADTAATGIFVFK